MRPSVHSSIASSDDSEVAHPASFTGALLYSSLARSMFGKHKVGFSNSLPPINLHSDEQTQVPIPGVLLASHYTASLVVASLGHFPHSILIPYLFSITARVSSLASCHTSSEDDEGDTQADRAEPYSGSIELGQDTLSLISHSTTATSGTVITTNTERGSTKSKWTRSRGTGAQKRTGSVKTRATKRMTRTQPKPRFAGKHKASLRVDDSQWSDRFSLDTVGSSGRVNCKTKEKITYEIGVKIDLSSSGLTKIVTLMPYFMIVNKANIDLECSEAALPEDQSRSPTMGKLSNEWIRVPAGEAVPFWPQANNSKKMLLRCRVNEHVVTDVFPYYESHSILMKLPGKYIGVFVEVETTEEATVIILQMYQQGMALVRLVNHLGDCQPIHFQQRGVNQTHQLEAGMSVMYAWDSARSDRELQFYCNKNDRVQSSRLTMDCVEEFYVNDTKAYWVSFLWNMQRVLLFTQDLNAAKNARLVGYMNFHIPCDCSASTFSTGYTACVLSGVRWSQVRRGNRLKPLKPAVSDSLERAYTTYANQLRTGESTPGLAKLTDVGRPIEVDFNQMMMLEPDQCELRRAFEPGVFLQYKTSPSQMQLHGKIFRIQVSVWARDVIERYATNLESCRCGLTVPAAHNFKVER
ncbi:unnamed protein product [Echinostoma caproni]|uniref:SHR-BD domain-containing protein n=1 Tax=Echinostoma caproni TaxID=27848 RepID=A0A183AUZ9_9TREM|nr:unnamed protein product [Echinostoma caproni]